MKLSDYVVSFVEKLGVKDVFMVSGGGCMHLVDSIGRNKNIRYICNHHEQASAIAVEGYARMKNDIGVAFVTTGPGGTNAITGVAGCWLDSIPALIISGQVKLETTIIDSPGLRQLGDQEINIIDVVKPITKYAVMVTDKNKIRYHLEKALYLAREGRPGPVWVDIPLDIQAAVINEEDLDAFIPPIQEEKRAVDFQIGQIVDLLKKAKRPLIIAGNGVRLAKGEKDLADLLEQLQIPAITAILGTDLITEDYPYYVGTSGIMGQRAANFAMQNCDLLISIGSRLMLRQISYNYEAFAREAIKVVVDADPAELNKKTVNPQIPVNCDAKVFIDKLKLKIKETEGFSVNCDDWNKKCVTWRENYPVVLPQYKDEKDYVNYYYFVEKLGEKLTTNDHIITTNGTAYVCTFQAIKLKQGQRLIGNAGLASMGYGLPAAIGACVANNRESVICIENDGSLQMNIQELQTMVHHKFPIKLFVVNNEGYLSIKITQRTYFPDNITAADPGSGVSCPDLMKIAAAYGIPAVRINDHDELDEKLEWVLNNQGPVICEIMMPPFMEMIPKVTSIRTPDGKMISKPLEDMHPFLPREEFYENMIIKPLIED